MNGECKSYRLNDPMTWNDFIAMPDDIKITYIKLIRQKFNTPDKYIAEMFGVCKDHIFRAFKKLGLQRDVRTSHPKWDKEGFYAWVNGVDKLPTPVIEEPTEEPVQAEPEIFMEDDLPVADPDFVPVEKYRVMDDHMVALEHRMEELLKENEELKAVNEKYKAENAWLRNECESRSMNVRILEAQMDVVRLIFGGKNHER